MERRSLRLAAVLAVACGVAFAQGARPPVLEKIGAFDCGRQPKQVVFSPDGRYVILPLLDDDGFDVFSVQERRIVRRVTPPQASKHGFAEGLFIPEKQAFLVSQMTTACVYEYSYPEFALRRTIQTGGTWSKFMAWSPDRQLLAVSNWVSDDVSLIDWQSGDVVATIATGKAPRGMAFTRRGTRLTVLSFDSGTVETFSIGDVWHDPTDVHKQGSLAVENAAMRHIAVSPDETFALVSDMYHRSVYKIDLGTLTVTATCRVFNNPNTIELLGGRWLFVSSRGPNNPQDYTKRSPANGKVTVIDATTMQAVLTIPGGNQPTGLALSPDGTLLCFSNFQDANIELYAIRQ